MSAGGYKYSALTGGGAGALDAEDGAALLDGDVALVLVGGIFYPYVLDDDSGAAESSPNIISPDTNAGNKRWILQRMPSTNSIPVGVVIPFIGGYFTSSANAGFTNVIGNTAATINTLVNGDGFYVCNGAALNLAGSSIFNGSGRYLPNLTDSRFLMGSTGAGSLGGSSTMAHTHTLSHTHSITHTHTTGSFTLTTNEIPSHNHEIVRVGNSAGSIVGASSWAELNSMGAPLESSYVGGGASHNHGTTGAASDSSSGSASSSTTSAASNTENRPLFLSCHYIMKVV